MSTNKTHSGQSGKWPYIWHQAHGQSYLVEISAKTQSIDEAWKCLLSWLLRLFQDSLSSNSSVVKDAKRSTWVTIERHIHENIYEQNGWIWRSRESWNWYSTGSWAASIIQTCLSICCFLTKQAETPFNSMMAKLEVRFLSCQRNWWFFSPSGGNRWPSFLHPSLISGTDIPVNCAIFKS